VRLTAQNILFRNLRGVAQRRQRWWGATAWPVARPGLGSGWISLERFFLSSPWQNASSITPTSRGPSSPARPPSIALESLTESPCNPGASSAKRPTATCSGPGFARSSSVWCVRVAGRSEPLNEGSGKIPSSCTWPRSRRVTPWVRDCWVWVRRIGVLPRMSPHRTTALVQLPELDSNQQPCDSRSNQLASSGQLASAPASYGVSRRECTPVPVVPVTL
jgi:hypothetical protein